MLAKADERALRVAVTAIEVMFAVRAGRLAEAETLAQSCPDFTPPVRQLRSATCVRRGHQWQVEFGPRRVLVGHSVGMLHLAVLLANHGAEIPSVELVAGVSDLGARLACTATAAQPMLDRVAITQYQQRLAELTEQLERLASTGRPDLVDGLRTEHDWLRSQLASATGINGRERTFADNAERARIAVGRAIRRAMDRIDNADPVIGAHLRRTVHTGVRCCYRPE
jgi:hypothetical protein